MEEGWRIYLKEHAPKLYEEMLESLRWSAQWRDEQIADLKAEIKVLEAEYAKLQTDLEWTDPRKSYQ